MSTPTLRSVHVDSALTNMSIAYIQKQSNFISTQVFPLVEVDFASDVYYTFDQGDFNRDEARLRAPGTESVGGGFKITNQTYNCSVTAFHHDIDRQKLKNADRVINLERTAVQFVTNKLLMRRELDWVDKYFKAGVWTAGDIAGVASAPSTNQVLQWNDANSDPILNVSTGKSAILQRTGFEPNVLVLGFEVYEQLRNHPDIIERVKYVQNIGANQAVKVNNQALADLFDVERVLVSKAILNTAQEGQTDVQSFIAGKRALLAYAAPEAALEMPSAGYTFSWQRYIESRDPNGIGFDQFEMKHLKAQRVEGEMAIDQRLISGTLGYFWNNIVA